jgi:hypothetical protein
MKPKYIIDLSKTWNKYPPSQRESHFEELKEEAISNLNNHLLELKKILNEDAFEILSRLIHILARSESPEDFNYNWAPIQVFTRNEGVSIKLN